MTQEALETQTIGSLLLHRAWEGGYCPATFAQRIGLGWSVWTRDVDRSLSELAIQQIGQAVNLEVGEVRAMTLTHMLGKAGIPTRRNGFQKWLTPVGIYHRKRLRYGQLYCPKCLKAGNNRLRMEWRLGSSWICGIHSILLRDSCPNCDAPFAPFRQDALMIGRCDRCSSSLLSGPLQCGTRREGELQLKVRSLWKQAFEGNTEPLSIFHQFLTNAATKDTAFRRAGEPWSYWRIAERRELLTKVADTFNVEPDLVSETGGLASRKADKPGYRRRRSLPSEPSARAELLLKLAALVRFPRRDKARIGKST